MNIEEFILHNENTIRLSLLTIMGLWELLAPPPCTYRVKSAALG